MSSTVETVLKYVALAALVALGILGVHLVLVPLGLTGSLLVLVDLGVGAGAVALWHLTGAWEWVKGLVGK